MSRGRSIIAGDWRRSAGLAAEFDAVAELSAGCVRVWKGSCRMRDWICGFFMAWGMFLAIPCPRKIWSEGARQKMLVCMPLVACWPEAYGSRGVASAAGRAGAGAGGGVRRRAVAGHGVHAPGRLHGRVRRGAVPAGLATRQRILKDSHCGAFAVICMVLLAMGQWSLFLAAEDVSWLALLLIPAATRPAQGWRCWGCVPWAPASMPPWAPGAAMGRRCGCCLPVRGASPVAGRQLRPLAAAAGYGLAVWYGYRNLDGMSGDISGFALTIGELCGCGAAILWR